MTESLPPENVREMGSTIEYALELVLVTDNFEARLSCI